MLDSDLDRYYEALGADARTSGVTVGDGASLVMLEASQGRDRLIRDGTGFVARRSRERFSLSALESIAATEPTRLSPNVLLRPVVESALLPTVTYLAGPAELRYLALTPPVYQRLGVHRQKPLPRWSGLLAEPRVDRVLDKFGITLEELAAQPGALEARLIRSQLPREALEALEALRSALESGYRSLGAVAVEIDPTMERPIQGARQQALSGTHEVERKLVQHLKRRQETEFSQLARARTAVLPGGKPQERSGSDSSWRVVVRVHRNRRRSDDSVDCQRRRKDAARVVDYQIARDAVAAELRVVVGLVSTACPLVVHAVDDATRCQRRSVGRA